MSIIKNARISADKRSIDSYGRAIELAITGYLMDTGSFPTEVPQLTIEYTGDELLSFGFDDSYIDEEAYCPPTDEVPTWLYNSKFWYWTMSPTIYDDDVWVVDNRGYLINYFVSEFNAYDDNYGVRPVITLSKSVLSS